MRNNNTNLGINIKALRKDRGLSLDKLAKAAHSSKSYIWEIENKPDLMPSVYKIQLIAIALQTTVDHLLTGESNSFQRGYCAAIYDAKVCMEEWHISKSQESDDEKPTS